MFGESYTTVSPRAVVIVIWLMPEHEDYDTWWQAPEYRKLRVKDLLPEYKIAEAQSNVKNWKNIKNV